MPEQYNTTMSSLHGFEDSGDSREQLCRHRYCDVRTISTRILDLSDVICGMRKGCYNRVFFWFLVNIDFLSFINRLILSTYELPYAASNSAMLMRFLIVTCSDSYHNFSSLPAVLRPLRSQSSFTSPCSVFT